jgi:uncharacterized protein YfaS (alpha-2-macroglobulin family)
VTNLLERDIGDAVRLSNTFVLGDIPTDPTAITLEVTDPSGNKDTYTHPATITKDATGVYHKDVSVDEVGEWHYRFVGTGTVEAVAQRRFAVRRTGA